MGRDSSRFYLLISRTNFVLNKLFPVPLDVINIVPNIDKYRNDFSNLHCNTIVRGVIHV
jgi:hypothetical protein